MNALKLTSLLRMSICLSAVIMMMGISLNTFAQRVSIEPTAEPTAEPDRSVATLPSTESLLAVALGDQRDQKKTDKLEKSLLDCGCVEGTDLLTGFFLCTEEQLQCASGKKSAFIVIR